MSKIPLGKFRGLQQVADERGMLTICAIDHRTSLQNILSPGGATYQQMVDFKLDMCRAVAPVASAVLLDPLFGAGQAIAAGALPGKVGLLVSVEESGYTGDNTARLTEIEPGWSVEKIKRMGASAVKLLVYFRPDIKDVAARQLDMVSKVADECTRYDIPLLVETVSYASKEELDKPELLARKKPEIAIETARQLTAMPIDVLKSEFPANMNYEKDEVKLAGYCRELDRVSRKPWTLLSGGASYDIFKKQVEIASKNGASGFLAGRALWQECVSIASREGRQRFLQDTTALRLKEIAAIADKYGKPWYSRLAGGNGVLATLPDGWYRSY